MTSKKLHWEPKIVAFLCNWCSYAAADLAGVRRLDYPHNVRIVRVPCTANVDPHFILFALERGADAVIVSGCSPGDCHYRTGNLHARRRLHLLKSLLAYTGFEEDRFHLAWISASEADLFVTTMKEVTARVRALGPLAHPKGVSKNSPSSPVSTSGSDSDPQSTAVLLSLESSPSSTLNKTESSVTPSRKP